MPDGGNRALHNENIGSGFLRILPNSAAPLRNGADCDQRAAVFDLANARRN